MGYLQLIHIKLQSICILISRFKPCKFTTISSFQSISTSAHTHLVVLIYGLIHPFLNIFLGKIKHVFQQCCVSIVDLYSGSLWIREGSGQFWKANNVLDDQPTSQGFFQHSVGVSSVFGQALGVLNLFCKRWVGRGMYIASAES